MNLTLFAQEVNLIPFGSRHRESGTRPVDRLLQRGDPFGYNQKVYVESFNGRLREECLNEHWFTSLLHARTVIETWRREYKTKDPNMPLAG